MSSEVPNEKCFSGPEASGEFEQDVGVRARFSRRSHGLADAHDAALGGGHGAFLLFVQRAGENDVRVVRGFVEEEIDRDSKIPASPAPRGSCCCWAGRRPG